MAEIKDKIVNLEDLKAGVDATCLKQEAVIKKVKSLSKAEYDAITIKDPNTLYNITDDAVESIGDLTEQTIDINSTIVDRSSDIDFFDLTASYHHRIGKAHFISVYFRYRGATSKSKKLFDVLPYPGNTTLQWKGITAISMVDESDKTQQCAGAVSTAHGVYCSVRYDSAGVYYCLSYIAIEE